jgi:4-aminobutyrate aminotransferase-like enzyme
MGDTHVMANIMTPSFTHKRFATLLKAELGQTRGSCPFSKFICMNSGSESVTVAFRIADVNAKNLTDEGARHAGKTIKLLSLEGSFHGRTDRPAQASDLPRQVQTVLGFARSREQLDHRAAQQR